MKNVLITGGSGGIGTALVKAFAAQGDKVCFSYCTKEKEAEALASACGALAVKADLRQQEDTDGLFQQARAWFGQVDVLVANAGIALNKMLADTSPAEWDDVIGLNLSGTYRTVKAALEDMLYRGGVILTVSSIWGQCGGACEAAYSASKAGLIGLTKALAKEYGNIRSNCICPGVIDTPMNGHLTQEEKEALKQEIPAGRFGTPGEVASLAVFLASENAAYITGQVIAVNGGMYI